MHTSSSLRLVAAALAACALMASGEHQRSVKLSMYYQTFCGACAHFMVDQLYDTWKHYGARLRVDIVPFGGPTRTFDLLEACAIHEACGPQGTLDCPVARLVKAMDYLRCLEKKLSISRHIECTREAGLDLAAVDGCATGVLGEQLEKKYSEQALTVKDPPIHYIPFIQINDKYNQTVQDEAVTDLMKLISSILDDQTDEPSVVLV